MKSTKEKPAKLTQHEKAPKSLMSVAEGIDQVLGSMNDIEKILKLSPLEFKVQHTDTEPKKEKTEDGGQDIKNQENKDENKDEKEKTDKSKTEKEAMITKDEEILKIWKTVDDKIEKIHKDWNNYESEGMKKGASAEKSKDLKGNLNLFTRAIENRDMVLAMDDGSKTLSSLSYFFDLYRDETYGDLSRIRYAVYQAYLNAKGNNVKEADKLLETTEEYITRIRQKLGEDKDSIKSLDKLSLSIGDMKQSLTDDSMKLWEIKRDIILENIKQLQK